MWALTPSPRPFDQAGRVRLTERVTSDIGISIGPPREADWIALDITTARREAAPNEGSFPLRINGLRRL